MHDAWYGYAEFCLFLGWEEDYLRARQALCAKFGATNNPLVAETTSRTCLLRPVPGEALRRAVALADSRRTIDKPTAKGYYPFFQFVHGLADYRQVTWTGRSP